MRMRKMSLWIVVGATLFCCTVMGQERASQTPVRSSAYDLKREGTLVGTVIAYTQFSTAPPLGAHVTLQTAGGVVDVHLGDGRFLTANHFTIQAGDTLRIIGENVAFGSAAPFLARIVQKGTQALAVRTERGIPVRYVAPKNGAESKPQGGVL
ncbi:MAG TPA: hypothetical protein VJY15_09595 [Candidatus Acidoferrum sp.]|nr:hypothetical protein [Candidatus Acidoferrum sp.]